jgi:hypothetical protein
MRRPSRSARSATAARFPAGAGDPRLLTPLVVVALERATAQAEALAARLGGRRAVRPSTLGSGPGVDGHRSLFSCVPLCRTVGLAAILAAVAGAHWIARRGETLTRHRPDPGMVAHLVAGSPSAPSWRSPPWPARIPHRWVTTLPDGLPAPLARTAGCRCMSGGACRRRRIVNALNSIAPGTLIRGNPPALDGGTGAPLGRGYRRR